ncbi:MAG: acyl-CoA thioesterase [Pelotomaculum sp.]
MSGGTKVQEYRFKHRLKVRFGEIDAAEIVFHPHFLHYLDIALSEYFGEGLKLPRTEMAKKGEFAYILKKINVEFVNPATVDEWLNIWCKVEEIKNTSFVVSFVITRDGGGEEDTILKATNVYVSYDFYSKKTRPVPDFVRRAINSFEMEGVTNY